jgi:CRP/FNR family transcriptional regulator, cyclic AMP receptor protein
VDLLEGLTAEERRQVLSSGRYRRFAPREVLFHEGDPADELLLIQRGRVAVQISTEMGESVSLVVLGPGEVIGELALLDDDARRSATVVALEQTEVWSFRRAAFLDLRRRLPKADDFLLRTLAADVRRLSRLLLESFFLPVETRVLRRLVDLERQYGGQDTPTVIPLTQDRVASLAGASRVTVNHVLREAASDGLITLGRGRIVILDAQELARRAQ